jgi:hypothetical protein
MTYNQPVDGSDFTDHTDHAALSMFAVTKRVKPASHAPENHRQDAHSPTGSDKLSPHLPS